MTVKEVADLLGLWSQLSANAVSVNELLEPLCRAVEASPSWQWTGISPGMVRPGEPGTVDIEICMGDVSLATVRARFAGPNWPDLDSEAHEPSSVLVNANEPLVWQSTGLLDVEVSRAGATPDDIAEIADLLFLAANFEFGGTGGIPGKGQTQLHFYLALAQTGFVEGAAARGPVVALLASCPRAIAVAAVPIVDSPAGRDLASRFLNGVPCAEVAQRFLEGEIDVDLTLVGLAMSHLPESHPAHALAERDRSWVGKGSLNVPGQPVEDSGMVVRSRRVARRG